MSDNLTVAQVAQVLSYEGQRQNKMEGELRLLRLAWELGLFRGPFGLPVEQWERGAILSTSCTAFFLICVLNRNWIDR